MPISTDRDEGPSNSERIAAEILKASQGVKERFPGYHEQLARAAIECFMLTAEHNEQRININQKYDELSMSIARKVGQDAPVGGNK